MNYLLFAGQCYYARGGFNDFQGSFPSIAGARRWVECSNGFEWWHIIDSETFEPVAYSGWQAYGCDEDSYVPDPSDDN